MTPTTIQNLIYALFFPYIWMQYLEHISVKYIEEEKCIKRNYSMFKVLMVITALGFVIQCQQF